MELYKRGNAVYYDYTDPVTGKRVRRSTKRGTFKEAQQVANAKFKSALDHAQLGYAREATLKEVLDDYLKTLEGRPYHAACEILQRKLLGGLTSPDGNKRWGLSPGLSLHQLSTHDVATLRSMRRGEGNSDQTINHEVKFLRAAYRHAQDSGVRVSPIKWAKGIMKLTPKTRYLSPAEEEAFLFELHPDRITRTLAPHVQRGRQDAYDLAVFLLDTGTRYNEAARIPWSRVDTVEWLMITIHRHKVGNVGRIALTKRLREVLQRRWKTRGNSAFVFVGFKTQDDDAPRTLATKAIKRAMDRAGLNAPHIVAEFGTATVHTLRHTFASKVVQRGLSLQGAQTLLGHASPAMTQRYAHLVPDAVAEQAARLLDEGT